jgi:hypothetical protein
MRMRPADQGDIAAITAIVSAAYSIYIPRLGKPPGPMLDDYAAYVLAHAVWVAEDEARRLGFSEMRLYTNEKMTENLVMYPRLGWKETGRGVQSGYDRVFFSKKVPCLVPRLV